MGIWENFEGMVSAEEIKEARESVFENPTAGRYPVEVMSIVCSTTQTGIPCVKFKLKNELTGKLVGMTKTLFSTTNPEYTPKNIANALIAIEDFTDTEVVFTNLAKLEKDIALLPMGKKCNIDVTYRNEDSKYPDIKYAGANVGAMDMPFEV